MTKISVLVIVVVIFIIFRVVGNTEFREYKLFFNKDNLDSNKLDKDKLYKLDNTGHKSIGYSLKGGVGGGRGGGIGGGRGGGVGGGRGGGKIGSGRTGSGGKGSVKSNGAASNKVSIVTEKSSGSKISNSGSVREISPSIYDKYPIYSRSPLISYRPIRREDIDSDIENLRRSVSHSYMYPRPYYYFNSGPVRRTNITDLNIYGNVDYQEEWKRE